MFLESRSLTPTIRTKLDPLIQKGVIFKEIIPDSKGPDGGHLICALYQGVTSHFYIFDNTNEREVLFMLDSVWRSLHKHQDSNI